MDANEASIGETDGERIRLLWSDTSWVPRKHGMGGQSKARFQRGRDEALKAWLRKVAEILAVELRGRSMVIGGPGMTKDEFIKELHPSLQAKITRVEPVGYTNENGLWELVGRSRYIK